MALLDRTPALIDVVEGSQGAPGSVNPENLTAAQQAAAAAAAAETSRAASATNAATAATGATQADTARGDAQAAANRAASAADRAESAGSGQGLPYDTYALMVANSPASARSAYVLKDANRANIGLWTRVDENSPWIWRHAATLPGVAADQATAKAVADSAGLDAAARVGDRSVDDATTGPRDKFLKPGLSQAETVRDDFGNLVRETDTLEQEQRDIWPRNMVESRVGVEGEPAVDQATGDRLMPLAGRMLGLLLDDWLFDFDAKLGSVGFGLPPALPSRGRHLWSTGDGMVRHAPDPLPYATGRPIRLGEQQPDPIVDILPQIILAETDVPRRTRVFQGIPTVEWCQGRLWAAWYGDNITNHEAYGNYVIVAFSDDDGLTWFECAYWVIDYRVGGNVQSRFCDPQLWCAPNGDVHLFGAIVGPSTDDGQNDLRFGCFVTVIPQAWTGKPRFTRPIRLSTYGIPTRPFLHDGRWLIALDLRESVSGPLYGTYSGTTLFEYDWRERQLIKVGKTSAIDNSLISFPEGAGAQLRDGSLFYMRRTAAGQYITKSANGDPQGPWSAPESFAALGNPGPNSRAEAVMTRLGNLVVAWNDTPPGTTGTAARGKMTLGISVDGGLTIARKIMLDASNAVSYPDISQDPNSDRLTIIWDRDRFTERAILIAHVSETALLAGTATVDLHIVDRQGA